jgi:hypothetical protein
MHSRYVYALRSQSEHRVFCRLILQSTKTLNSCTFFKDKTQLQKPKLSGPSVAPIPQILASDCIAYFEK